MGENKDLSKNPLINQNDSTTFREVIINNADMNFSNNKINTAKYSPLLFIPKFLFDQFSKLANLFFLIVGLLEQIPGVSPVGRYITLVPLFLILMVSAVKEIIEDSRRRLSDGKINSLPAEIFGNFWQKVEWKDLHVGNIIRICTNQVFPADVIIIATNETTNSCYVQTASLDGETNYKMRQCNKKTTMYRDEEHLRNIRGHILCDKPNNNLYSFKGNGSFNDGESFSLGNDQIILRGSVLRNTAWVIGVIVYTGHETKIMLNSSKPTIKRSTVDRDTNWLVLILMAILFIVTLVCASIYDVNIHEKAYRHWYLYIKENMGFTFHFSCITFFILFHNIIPISLSVTLEIVKMFQAYGISRDEEMHVKGTDTYAIVKTTSILEEIGQVNYIFTDKTGTLTTNEMILKRFSTNGVIFNISTSSSLSMQLTLQTKADIPFDMFIRNLLICNSVVPESGKTKEETIYQSSSPDETSIVQALASQNFKFTSRIGEFVTLELDGKREVWTILNIIDFTSDRKRMSVVAKSPDNKIFLFCKGADSIIMQRLNNTIDDMYKSTMKNLEEFSKEGLRTLCIAYREIPESEYDIFAKEFNLASMDIDNRVALENKVAEKIENNLLLLGCTGIEDKLQENIKNSIELLRNADIKIWMLTGDKLETAENIAYSCGLLPQDIDLRILNASSVENCIAIIKGISEEKRIRHTQIGKLRQNPSTSLDLALIVTGQDLTYALDAQCLEWFLDLAILCKSVICCRISPLQKSSIVLMVKDRVAGATTLAIGDGGNDCSMIQAAHVGVGIIGKEGMQAANTADFAIGQFSHLTRLLFVHGANSYQRSCNCIYFCFYKNIVFNLMPLYYNFLCVYSGQVIFSKFSMAFFNVLYTSAAPFCFGILDKRNSDEASSNIPTLYKNIRNTYAFGIKRFLCYVLNGIFHSVLIFYLCYALCHDGVITYDGHPLSISLFGNIVFTQTLIVITFKAALELRYWSWLTHCGIWCGIIFYVISMTIFCRRYPMTFWLEPDFLDADVLMYQSPLFWLSLGIPLIVLFPDFIYHCIRNTLFPPSYIVVSLKEYDDVINWHEKRDISKIEDEVNQSILNRDNFKRSHFGFAFSTSEDCHITQSFSKASAYQAGFPANFIG